MAVCESEPEYLRTLRRSLGTAFWFGSVRNMGVVNPK